jgi:microcystin-dependent protein
MKNKIYILLLLSLFSKTSFGQDQFVAEIRVFAGNFAPKGWAFCNGQILPISQNTALFSLLGTTYGGDGRTTFALPDLRERVAIAPGQGQGLSLYDLGEKSGQTPLVLIPQNLPPHSHTADIKVSSSMGTTTTAAASGTSSYAMIRQVFNGTGRDIWPYTYSSGTITTQSASFSTSVTGASMPIYNRQPYLVCHYIIALQGIFPPRQ